MTTRKMVRYASVLVAATLAFAASIAQAENGHRKSNACVTTASLLHGACRLGVREDMKIGSVVCLNISDKAEFNAEFNACLSEFMQTTKQAKEDCEEQFEARDDVCDLLPQGPYDPAIDPDGFVDGIDNPYAPFAPGSRWVYESRGGEGVERIEINVLATTHEILGIDCTIVRDDVYVDGVLVESTEDYLAQDLAGNVWYFGELSQNFEDGRLQSLDGSFIAGVDGAKAGFWMKAAPVRGETYRQEWAPGEAEDMATIASVDADIEVPFQNGGEILQVRESTPISPGSVEFKYFVPGVGFVLETKPGSDERLELIEYTPG